VPTTFSLVAVAVATAEPALPGLLQPNKIEKKGELE